MSYIHLTIEKRSQMEVLRKEGYSVRRIASLIGVHHSTVARELNRIEGEYSAIKAQQLAISKSANKGRPTKWLSVKCWGVHPTSLLWHQSYLWLVPFFLYAE